MIEIFPLTDKEKEIFVMFFQEGKSAIQISKQLHLSVETVLNTNYNAISGIRKKLVKGLTELKMLTALRKENANLKAENDMYKQSFELLPAPAKEEIGNIPVLKRSLETLKLNVRLWKF